MKTTGIPMMSYHADLYCNVLREVGHPLDAHQLARFPLLCEDWLARHPFFPQAPGATAVMILRHSTLEERETLVRELEAEIAKQPIVGEA